MNLQNILKLMNQFSTNKDQILSSLNIPVECRNNPQDAIQYLMNTGKITQADYNNANAQLKQLQNNPMFRQFFNK